MRLRAYSLFRSTLAFALGAVSLAAPAGAQTTGDPSSNAAMRLGPLGLTPAISLMNVGIDSNVFNESHNPKQDYTAALRPRVTGWLHLGRALLSVEGQGEALYFQKYVSERSVNGSGTGTLAVRANRLGVFLGAGYGSTRQRSGFEIDTRARTTNSDVFAGATVRLFGKTSLVARALRRKIQFDENADNLGTSLSQALDREERTATASLEYSLTPLTTVRLSADVQQDRFAHLLSRDTRSFRLAPGIDFRPNSHVSGGAMVGFRRVEPADAGMRPFSGLVGSADLAYTFRGLTRVGVQSLRDVQYSFDPSQEYYVLSGAVGSISQALGQTWGVSVRAGRQYLTYHTRPNTVLNQRASVDMVKIYGGSIFWRVTPEMQTGVNADYQNRRSPEFRQGGYEGLRVGLFISYGLRGQ
jgi:hypothetical protein